MSKSFSMTFHDIAVEVLKKLGIQEGGEQSDPDLINDAKIIGNLVIKELSIKGVDIPWRETITVFLSKGQKSYLLGAGGDHATASYVETTLLADGHVGDTALSLASTAGINANDNLGVRLDDGTIHWSTFGGVSMITEGLIGVASAGNAVYAYTSVCDRPQGLIYAMRRDGERDTPVSIIGEIAYQSLSNKGQIGYPNQVFYRQNIPQGTLYVWPTGASKLVLITQVVVDDINSLTDRLEIPMEWANTIIWLITSEMAPNVGTLSAKDQITIYQRAQAKLADLLAYDVENASVILSLDLDAH